MQKVIFGIFAHPDDESFGPSGTLVLEARAGTEIHLITLTAGESGMNPDNHENLADVRITEWRQAGKLIGAAEMVHLGYQDGTLGNHDHLAITQEISLLVHDIVQGRESDVEIEFMTIDLNGITGHIDHIVAARSACLAFYRLRDDGLPMSRIRLACIPHDDTSFVYMEQGRTDQEVDEVIDARSVRSTIQEIIRCHHTQRSDGNALIDRQGDQLGIDHFIVKR